MLAECKADGMPADELPLLIPPIESMFQGKRAEIFPVRCTCGQEWMGFIDLVNRDQVEERRQNAEQLLAYNPYAASRFNSKEEFVQDYVKEKHAMVLLSKDDFARRVALERNQFVRDSLQRKCDERKLNINWAPPPPGPKLVARLTTS
jgi:hypothetical protein